MHNTLYKKEGVNMNKIIFGIFLIGLVLIFGCVQDTRQQHMGEEMMEDMMGEEFEEEMEEEMEEHMGGEMIEEMEEHMGEDEEPKVIVKEFTMTARQWDFTPSTITVNKGDTVKITITSTDVTHGFAISEYGINTRVSPGTTEVVEFTADKEGTFIFRCSVPCGSGHSGMEGTLVVK